MTESLADVVRRFLDDLTPTVEAVGGKPADVALDAFELTAAFVDADGLHTDNELLALIGVFGPLLESQLGRATPGDVRAAGLVTGKRAKLERPSPLFDVLLAADRRTKTATAWTYYELAMAMGHEIAALDTHVSHLELAALESYRTALLNALRDVPRAAAPPATTPPAATAAPARTL